MKAAYFDGLNYLLLTQMTIFLSQALDKEEIIRSTSYFDFDSYGENETCIYVFTPPPHPNNKKLDAPCNMTLYEKLK